MDRGNTYKKRNGDRKERTKREREREGAKENEEGKPTKIPPSITFHSLVNSLREEIHIRRDIEIEKKGEGERERERKRKEKQQKIPPSITFHSLLNSLSLYRNVFMFFISG